MTAQELERFWAKVSPEPNSGCWLWTGGTAYGGYGSFKCGNKVRPAHRTSYEHFVGEIPPKLFLLHSCDIPCCVNPDHLTPGTQLENMRDMHRKGRGAYGEKNKNSGLTSFGVRYVFDMIAAGKNYSQIAKHLDISKSTIGRIAAGKSRVRG